MPERTRFERELADLGLRECEQSLPGGKRREAVVGERIVLDLGTFPFPGKIVKVRWTIPGTIVRGYDGGLHNAKVFDVTAADLEQPKISFFWVDPGDNRKVAADITLESYFGGTVKTAVVVVYDVKGPKLDYFKPETGITQIEKLAGLTGMRFGKLRGDPASGKPREKKGILWKWKVTMPAALAGFVKDVQTVVNDRRQILLLRPGGTETRTLVWRHPQRSDQHAQLDGHADGEAGYTAGLHDEKIEAGKSSIEVRTSDSPHAGLPSLGKVVSVNDRFTYYIMFKPATPNPADAIWVPVAKAEWFWKATAKNIGGRWSVVPAKMVPALHKTTTDFPKYESNAEKNEWMEVQ
jgi:hypothetical protein